MDISRFKPTIVYVTYVASTPEKVWQALTSAEFSKQYFSAFGVEIEPKVGGRFKVRAPDGSEHITGEVIAWDPPRKLTVTWDVNWPGLVEALGSTLVTYDIEPAGDVVRLTLTQANDREISDDILSGGRSGWPAILSSLKSLLETGTALTIKMEPPMKMLEALKQMGIKLPGG
ncbi:SRPBCC family protein [Afipia sp. TerB]